MRNLKATTQAELRDSYKWRCFRNCFPFPARSNSSLDADESTRSLSVVYNTSLSLRVLNYQPYIQLAINHIEKQWQASNFDDRSSFCISSLSKPRKSDKQKPFNVNIRFFVPLSREITAVKVKQKLNKYIAAMSENNNVKEKSARTTEQRRWK